MHKNNLRLPAKVEICFIRDILGLTLLPNLESLIPTGKPYMRQSVLTKL